jgi:urease accessory protein
MFCIHQNLFEGHLKSTRDDRDNCGHPELLSFIPQFETFDIFINTCDTLGEATFTTHHAKMISPVLKETSPETSHQRARGVGDLGVVHQDGKTSIKLLYQEGCAKIRVPKSHSSALEAVMINTSGGMTGGDTLNWTFTAAQNTNLSVTTQACERVYKSSHGVANMNVNLNVQADASLHWLPQETILFDQCGLKREINVNIESGCELLMAEPLVFGRQAMGENQINGSLHDRWRIHCDGQLIHAEDFKLEGNMTERLENPFVTNGHIACATVLFIAPRAEGVLQEAKSLLQDVGAVSFWNGKLLARIIAPSSYELRQAMYPLIQLLRDGKTMPKIWAN